MAERTIADLVAVTAGHAVQLRTPTVIPRLTIWRSDAPTDPTPAMCEPKFYIVLQGAKRMAIGGRTIDFGASRYSVSSVGLPFTGQVIRASPDVPYLGVEMGLDAGLVASLLLDRPAIGEISAPIIEVAEATEDIVEALGRFLGLLDRPDDVPVLGPLIERELTYRLLQGPMGDTLRQLVQGGTRFHQVRAAVEWLCANAYEPLSVTRLATSVGMSATSFHRHFKAVTGYSPLAYQRHIRLIDARRLIATGATSVTRAAFATGYASASQFSREYKRLFGVPPVRDALALQQ